MYLDTGTNQVTLVCLNQYMKITCNSPIRYKLKTNIDLLKQESYKYTVTMNHNVKYSFFSEIFKQD